MLNFLEELKLLNIKMNIHYLQRYLKFIGSRTTKKEKYKTHFHHILPKAKDMFPQYKDLKIFKENGIHLTQREHFVAHWILANTFPGTSQSLSFYNMCNILNKRNSRAYELARLQHIETLKITNQSPERNNKISKALSGKPKSAEHIKSMMNHIVSEETREKIRIGNTGKIMSKESCNKMSISRTGKKKHLLSQNSKNNISLSKMSGKLLTPFGIFLTYNEAAQKLNIPERNIRNIFRKLSSIPRSKNLIFLNIKNPNKLTWGELGFNRI